MDRIARFDTVGRKLKEHAHVRTSCGAALSVAAVALALVLLAGEARLSLRTRVESHVLVDASQGAREFEVRLDLTFHALQCKDVSLVSEDAKGVPYEEARLALTKTPVLTAGGAGSAAAAGAGAASAFAPGGADAAAAAAAAAAADAAAPGGGSSGGGARLGCRVAGTARVRRVAGHIHVAAPRSLSSMEGRLVFSIAPDVLRSFNASHTVNRLAFGPHFPGQVSPLDGVTSLPQAAAAAFQYHIKVVPTVFEPVGGGAPIDSQQYSASDFVQVLDASGGDHGHFMHPGVWFKYDFSPIMVRLVETRRSFLQFLTSACAILGGVFALSGVIDAIVFRVTDEKTK